MSSIALTHAKEWKNEKSKWEYSAVPVNLQYVQRISLLIFTNGEASGSILLDNLRVEPDESPLLPSGSLTHRDMASGIDCTGGSAQHLFANIREWRRSRFSERAISRISSMPTHTAARLHDLRAIRENCWMRAATSPA